MPRLPPLLALPPARRRLVLVLVVVGAVLASLLLSLPVPGPPWPPPASAFRPSADVLGVLGLALALGGRLPRGGAAVLGAVLVLGRMLRSGDALMITYFGRTVTLYLDVALVPELARLLVDTMGWVAAVAIGLAILGGAIALAAVLGAWLRLAAALPARMRAAGVAAVVVVGLAELVARAASQPSPNASDADAAAVLVSPSVVPRLAEEVDFVLHVGGFRRETAEALDDARARVAAAPKGLERLAGVDVHVLFVESYGDSVWTTPDQREVFDPALRTMRDAAAKGGWHVRSGSLVSPTFGGASWLAHGTLASAVSLTSQLRFDVLVTSDLVPIATHLRRAGHRTVELMPGTKRPFPEGRWFGYDRHLYRWHFGYEGRRYDWAPMPDQFVLDTLLRQVILPRKPDDPPVFTETVLVSSHAPFRRQPPYLDDWDALGDGEVFRRLDPVLFDVPFPDMTTAGPAYAASIAYVFRCLTGFLARLPVDRPAVLFVLGDHQPNPQITGPGAPWTVPIHVLSRRRSLVDAFGDEAQLDPGWAPGPSEEARGMETFLPTFLEAFAR